MGVQGRAHRQKGVLIEQDRIAREQQSHAVLVAKVQPTGPISQDICAHACGRIQRCAHTCARLAIPADVAVLNAGGGPQRQLLFVCAAVIPARGKQRTCIRDGLQRGTRVSSIRNRGGVICRADHDEIIIHDFAPMGAESACQKRLFGAT